jgi:hypothetical protein
MPARHRIVESARQFLPPTSRSCRSQARRPARAVYRKPLKFWQFFEFAGMARRLHR